MTITIYQGNDQKLRASDINIVIDVIRAFTVAHYAFLHGAKNILLVPSVEEAFWLKSAHPHYLLAGEVNGLAIQGFDLDNSPKRLLSHDVKNKTLVQKTTNGVKATLNSLNAENVFVTGFSNAKTTATYVRDLGKDLSINIIASHPTGDDDLACAEYIRGIIKGENGPTASDVMNRIKNSFAAQKFYDPNRCEFNREDIDFCMREINSDFVMWVNKSKEIPTIERLKI
ncbi:2-phosphosulfolactate phosphatase [Anoxybacteroides tepidamans]|uniref:2-phosphosulfolactate phosphatase n=1 Tax=Anoxybacteroides tepidamans TaxID=265948 RepID=UPI000486A0F6|nr:2-phosphosulfolactate phosphatase [Anoxybacillus tepidamans]